MLSKKYQSAIETSTAFMAKIEDLVREIAIQNSIPYYRIESQMEHHPHMSAEDVYMPVIRIITYFEDTVSKVADILQSEFDIIKGKSIDKKKNRLDSFSYKHIQYIGSLKANRRDLTEYKRCGDKKFEIQLCSMLQDAWSGIEKELGYDTAAFPDESKRDFYRVGALLEMADIEFLKMRTENGKRNEQKEAPVTHHTVAQHHTASYVPQAEPVAPATTFAEHLQAVVHEVPAQPQVVVHNVVAQPVAAQPEPTPAPAAPVQEAPQAVVSQVVVTPIAAPQPEPVVYVAPPVQEQPQTVVNNIVAQPEPVYVAPVQEQPQPVAQPEPVYVAPVQEQPQAVVPPVAPKQEEVLHPLVAAYVASIVPKAAVMETPKPAAPALGIVPQRVTLSAEAPMAEMNVDRNGTLAIENTPVTPKNIIEEHIADITNIGPLVEQQIPTVPAIEEAQHTIASFATAPIEVPQPIAIPETIAPIANMVSAVVPEVTIAKAAEQVIPNVAAETNNIAAKVSEVVREQAQPVVNAVPFFEDAQPKPIVNRVVALDENAPMTDSSLREYVINSKLLKEVDMRIAERAGAKINSEIDIEGDVERLRFLKVFTLKQLHDRLTDNKNDIVAFAEKWIGKDNGGSFDSGISLFYLEYLLVGKKNDPAFAIEYVVKFISDNDYSARYIIPTYNSIRNSADVSTSFAHLTLRP
ncbi:MAG: hypothetical protein JWQ38_905 [Flavipsychrobacter sp.]|nr:hypothetical protein [Flavipsychrobacter sp.]